ncbi:MAG: family 78 glycoside hydrolase catalytic domain, partial [Eubacteriales bacterium]
MLTKRVLALVLCFAIILPLGLNSYAVNEPAATEVVGLKTNLITNPVGIEGTPSFSWQMSSGIRGQYQMAYQIKLSKSNNFSNPVWDTGKIESGVSVGIKCSAALQSSTKYYWVVKVWDKVGNISVSDAAAFETGLLDNSLWGGSDWIQVGIEPTPQRLVSKLVRKEDVYDVDNQAETIEYIYVASGTVKFITRFLPRSAALAINAVFGWLVGRELKNVGSATFRKEFNTETEIESAKLYVTSLGIFDAYINGKRVGNIQADGTVKYDELKPGYTYTGKRAFYYSYDVKSWLSENTVNTISATVSNGWWRDSIVSNIGKKSALKAKLVITYKDGTTKVVSTDTSWKTKTCGPVLAATIYDGEVYDANADTAWRKSGYNDNNWVAADLNTEFAGEISSVAIGSNVRVRDDLTLKPISITVYKAILGATTEKYGNIKAIAKYSDESFVLKRGQIAVVDFGQNFAGWTQITATGEKGTVVKMRHAEILNEKDGVISRGNDGAGGSIYVKNLRGASGKAIYVMNGSGNETYHPAYTYFGFRYTQITANEDITVHALKGLVVTSVEKETGTITTSDKDLNQLSSNAFWGQYSNYVSAPTDCPQRDERLGWCADTQVFSTTACYNAESYAFLRKWMQDMRDSQREDGAFSVVAPYGKYMWHGQLGWSDAGVIVPYNLYKMYGDKTIIEENYNAMQKFMDVYMASTGKIGGGWAYGDWLAYEANDDDLKRLIGIAYFAWDAQMMAEMATALGKTGDAVKYQAVYNEEKAFFIQEYVNADGTMKRKEQTACLMALKMNLLPNENSKDI